MQGLPTADEEAHLGPEGTRGSDEHKALVAAVVGVAVVVDGGIVADGHIEAAGNAAARSWDGSFGGLRVYVEAVAREITVST